MVDGIDRRTSDQDSSAASSVRIIESFINERRSVDYAHLTKRLLATVPGKYLVGLDSVVLCNLAEQPRRIRTGTLPRRGRKVRRERVVGLYHRAWKGKQAWIQIFVDRVPKFPAYVRWFRLLTEIVFARVLYHELGHHAHTIRPEYREKEDVADKWAGRFMNNHLRKAHWYAYPLLRCVAAILRFVERTRQGRIAKH